MLRRCGLPLALATIELDDGAELVDLDRPEGLAGRGLRPSMIATRRREVTQPQALAIYDSGADGLRWWSTFESSWINVTLFDRVPARLRVGDVRAVDVHHPVVAEALDALGIAAV